MEYIKLGHVAERIAGGDFTAAQLLAGINDDDWSEGHYVVVNVKGLILTAAQVSSHLSGGVDGETLVWNS